MATQRTWVRTGRPPKDAVTREAKARLLERVEAFVDSEYRDRLRPPPKGHKWNYVHAYAVKWRGSFLYVIAKYACPGPNAISPEFDAPLARIGAFGHDRFSLWARRHNDEWLLLYDGITLDECFENMKADPWFQR